MSASVLEIPRFQRQPVIVTRAEQEAVPGVGFTTAEVSRFQNDDAMAAGMMASVLGLAFLVLLALTIGVSVWTLTVAG